VAPGDAWRGVHRFDKLILRQQAKVVSLDRVVATLDSDASSSLTMNAARPNITAATLSSAADGNFVTGSVTDPDAPIVLTVTNVRTAQTFTGTAAEDGSFRIALSGLVGDTFRVVATDGHALPMTSRAVDVSGAVIVPSAMVNVLTNIAPPALAALTASVEGAVVRGTVVLSAPAPEGGALVVFDTFTIVVPEGELSATFEMPRPDIEGAFTITATYRATITIQVGAPR
jgi:hypothetical protein